MAEQQLDALIDKLKPELDAFLKDPAWVEKRRWRDEMRQATSQALRDILVRYLNGAIETAELKATFDKKTRGEWLGYGLKGMSGAMFLNKLANNFPDQEGLARELKTALRAPEDAAEGKARMQHFSEYLRGPIKSGIVRKVDIQPARVGFFLSSWWHMQQPDLWPIYYDSGRKYLNSEGVFKATKDVVADYFTYRELFLSIRDALGVTYDDCEYLLVYCRDKGLNPTDEETDDEVPPDEDDGDEADVEITHAQVQCLLAQMGRRFGCSVWIATNDHGKEWKGQRLGNLSISSLPMLGLDADSQKIISLIDVVWLKGNHILAAFEIEHTTSIYSGLLRMSDLVTMAPNLNFDLYVVAPQVRADRVRRELARPTFAALDLHTRCSYIVGENLVKESGSMLKWASDPDAIKKLAKSAGDGLTQ